MPYPDLRSFITALESAHQLRRIRAEVDPELEITEIADRVSKSPCPECLAAGDSPPAKGGPGEVLRQSGRVGNAPCPPYSGTSPAPPTDPIHGLRGGHALLFEKVRGSAIPVAINLYGSYTRMKLALGCEDFESLAAKVQKLAKPEPPTTLMEKMKMLPELAKIAGYAPKQVKRGPCQEVVHTGDQVDLFALPIIKCWPHDAAEDWQVTVPARGGHSGSPPAKGGLGGVLPHTDTLNPHAHLRPSASSVDKSASSADPNLAPRANPQSAIRNPQFPPGRYITFAGIHTTLPDGSQHNIGMYRIQITGPRSAIFHCHVHHDGARHHRAWAAQGKEMPVAIVLGGESVLPYAATCPLPPGVSELLFAGFLNESGIPLVEAKTVPLKVPASAEIVIEGYVSATDYAREGPFGDHTGFYSLATPCPTMRVTAITHRENPIYPTTIVGPPPMEDYYMGKATERVFLPLLQMLIPDIIDYHLPMWGAFHNCCVVKIRKEYPYQARKVASSIWGAGQMMFSKFIIIVDEDVNVHDEQDVMFHVGANVDPRRDTCIVEGPMDILDHAAPYEGAGSKMCIDATRKIAGEGVVRDWPKPLRMSDEVKQLVDRRWNEYGL